MKFRVFKDYIFGCTKIKAFYTVDRHLNCEPNELDKTDGDRIPDVEMIEDFYCKL